MSNLEAPQPNYPFNFQAVQAHGHAAIELSMKITEQNNQFLEDLPLIEDTEIHDLLHYELYADQQAAFAERNARLSRIPQNLITTTLDKTTRQLNKRLDAFEAIQAEVATIEANIEAKHINKIAAEIILGRDSELLQAAFDTHAERAERRIRQVSERDGGFAFGEFAMLAAKVEQLSSLYLPNRKAQAPSDPVVPAPTNMPAALQSQPSASVATEVSQPQVVPPEAKRVAFSAQAEPDITPAHGSLAVPTNIFREPDQSFAVLGKNVLPQKRTVAQRIAAVLLAQPGETHNTQSLAVAIYGPEDASRADKSGGIRARGVGAALSKARTIETIKAELNGHELQVGRQLMHPENARPGKKAMLRTLIRILPPNFIENQPIPHTTWEFV
ncbi:MAG TPA: hypothetical protein VJR27_02535 [Candidatus Saccharimonadales bacterium]|nr:hypothetical protein [Candidatus Saccharimonadales bacterium]